MNKRCAKCMKSKNVGFFGKCKRMKDGLKSDCKACQREYRQVNREAIAKSVKKLRENNKEAISKSRRKYRLANKEIITAQRAKYYQANKEANAEYVRANMKHICERNKKRYAKDPKYSLKIRLGALMRHAINRGEYRKSKSTLEALGCTTDEFSRHIERQFKKGMCWSNRDKWHLDHIIPISSADTEEDVYRLSHYLNIQPLWATDNLKKGSQRCHLI